MKPIWSVLVLALLTVNRSVGQDAEVAYARAMYDTAVSYFMHYELDSGEVYLDEALTIFEEYEVWDLYAAAKTDKIQLGMMQGRSGMDALQDYRAIEADVLPNLGDAGEFHAKTYYHIGLHYYYTGQYVRAEEYMRRSLKAMEQLGPNFDYRRADVLNLLANINRMLNRTELVIALYEEAISFGERADPNDYQGALQKRANLMDAWAAIDSLGQMEEHMLAIESIAPKLDPNDRLSQAILAETRAKYLASKGSIQEAFALFLTLEKDHPTFYTANDQRERLVLAKARLARQLGRNDLAAAILDEAVVDPILRNNENIYKLLTVHALEDHRPSVALRFARKMESLALPLDPDSIDKGSDLLYGSFASLTAVRYVVRSLDALADSSVDLRYNAEVLDYIQSFGRMLDILRRKADLGELISLRDEVWIEVYELGIKSAFRMYSQAGDPKFLDLAWNMSEAAKAAVLLGSVNRVDPAGIEGAPMDLIARERDIKSALLYAQSQMQNEPESADIWRTDLLSRYASLDSLMVAYETDYPTYTSRRFSPKLTTLEEAMSNMGDGELLVSYFYGQNRVYGMSVSASEVQFEDLGATDTIQSLLADYRAEINVRPSPEGFSRRMDRFDHTGSALYQALLEPLLSGADLPGLLTVIPDGALSYLPFGALPVSGALTSAGRPVYLTEHSHVHYAYAHTALEQPNAASTKKFDGNVLALAPVFTGHRGGQSKGRGWGPIPGAAEEVNHLKHLFPGAITRVDTTNLNWFFQHAGRHHVIHLATHAYADPVDPFSSALLLDGGPLAGDRGVLRTADLYTMSIPASLVVLSACNTGDGPVKRGEGVMSIAHAFAYAGSPAVVMTLWPANDATTQSIIAAFYDQLSEGYRKSHALASAQRAYLKGADAYHAHPYFWASVVSFGDDRPIPFDDFDKGFGFLWYVILLGFLAGALLVLWRRHQHHGSA